jgi:hypothetical protein
MKSIIINGQQVDIPKNCISIEIINDTIKLEVSLASKEVAHTLPQPHRIVPKTTNCRQEAKAIVKFAGAMLTNPTTEFHIADGQRWHSEDFCNKILTELANQHGIHRKISSVRCILYRTGFMKHFKDKFYHQNQGQTNTC